MPMTPNEIKEELKRHKLTMAAVGRRLRPKVSPVSVYKTVEQIPGQTSKRIERAVAKAIGKEREEVFGNAA